MDINPTTAFILHLHGTPPSKEWIDHHAAGSPYRKDSPLRAHPLRGATDCGAWEDPDQTPLRTRGTKQTSDLLRRAWRQLIFISLLVRCQANEQLLSHSATEIPHKRKTMLPNRSSHRSRSPAATLLNRGTPSFTLMGWPEKYTSNKTGEGLITIFTGSPVQCTIPNLNICRRTASAKRGSQAFITACLLT
jgi:hypothetical protein